MVSLVLSMFVSRACNRYNARWISKTKSQNTKKWRNAGIINPLFHGLTYNTSGHVAHCWYCQCSFKYPRVFYIKHRIMSINSQKQISEKEITEHIQNMIRVYLNVNCSNTFFKLIASNSTPDLIYHVSNICYSSKKTISMSGAMCSDVN